MAVITSEPLYPTFLPFYDPLERIQPIEAFEHDEPSFRADPSKPNLLRNATGLNDLSPHVGTELLGVQLDELSTEGLDELALLLTERGCVVFRDQKYADIGFQRQTEIASHFGPLHLHPSLPRPHGGPPQFVIVYDGKDDQRIRKVWEGTRPVQFHVDQSAESQPPGVTFFCVLESPRGGGGDTIFASTTRAFETLSPTFSKRLEGLWAVHAMAKRTSQKPELYTVARKPPSRTSHPVVTIHPVTRKKNIFVNPVFTERIVGMNDEESACILDFLHAHIRGGHDFSCRVNYQPGTVVVWDQRCVQHSQTLDYPAGERRHLFRLTALANVPIPSKVDEDD